MSISQKSLNLYFDTELLAFIERVCRVACAPSLFAAIAMLLSVVCVSPASGQRVRIGDSFVTPNAQIAPPLNLQPQGQPAFNPGFRPNLPPASGQPVLPAIRNPFPSVMGQPAFQQPVVGQPNLVPQTFPGIQQFPQGMPQVTVPQGAITRPPAILQQPVFDPFSTRQPPAASGVIQNTLPPGGLPPQLGILGVPNGGQQPTTLPPYIYPTPYQQQQFNGQIGGVYGNPYGANPFGGQPNVGYGGYGNGSYSNSPWAWPSQAWARLRSSQVYRLLERPRWRHTYLAADSSAGSRGLGLNESEIATTLTLPNFLFTAQPIRLSPGFVFHFWDGPNTAVTGADLPGQTYSTYLASDFTTPWDRPFGAELNVTVGVYTDFDEVTSDSLRITGVGLGWLRLNNTTTFKFGVEYLDRVRVKMLPAIGFFIYPTPDLKFDLYFPRPKFAQRLPNLGNYEVWGYVGGEYGGGSWTIKRLGGMGDQVDMNDIRVFGGFEWVGPKQVTGFAEIGYVFDRELIYRSDLHNEIDIDDTFMVRAGIAF